MSTGLEPIRDDGLGLRKLKSSTGTNHQHIVGCQLPSIVGAECKASRLQVSLAGRITHVDRAPRWCCFPIQYVLKNVSSQRLRDRVGLGSSGHIHLAKQDHPATFPVLHERAVLETET